MHWYVDQVLRLTTTDQWARRRFLEVQGMLREASAILKPDMLFRVLLDLLQPRFLRRPVHKSPLPLESENASVAGRSSKENRELVSVSGGRNDYPSSW